MDYDLDHIKFKSETTNRFFEAYIFGHMYKAYEYLADDEFNPNDVDNFGETVIMDILYSYLSEDYGITQGDFIEVVSLILGNDNYNGGQINEFNETPLFIIARNPLLNFIAKKFLKQKDAKILLKNDAGMTIFEVALYNNNNEFISMLLETGNFSEITRGIGKNSKENE